MKTRNAFAALVLATIIALVVAGASHSNARASVRTERSPQRSTSSSPQRSPTLIPMPAAASSANTYTYLPFVLRSPPPRVYWGALVYGLPPNNANMQPGGPFDTFEIRAQKKMSVLHWGQPWKMNGVYQNFYAPWFTNVRQHGSIPLIDWGSWNLNAGPSQPEFKLSAIYGGQHDAYIRQWANDAKAWGYPFFMRFDWEMNGNWQFPWSEQLNGNQPGDYIKAWRYVHDLFAQAGVTNVTWVWCPNIVGLNSLPISTLYPGDGYVDWTCLDGYNKESVWLNFNQVFNGGGLNWVFPSYDQVLAVAPGKPIMIAETASLEANDGGARKAAWITDAFVTQLPTNFPKIKAVLWFNWDEGIPTYTFPIESTTASTNAFASGISSPYYAANTFGALTTSPIPPLQ